MRDIVLRLFQIILACGLMTFTIHASTLSLPFFTIDESDLLNRVRNSYNEFGMMAYLKSFVPNLFINRRYWPGFYIYTLVRYQLFEFCSAYWHIFQLGLFTAIGTLLVVFARRITNHFVPGFMALFIILTAGTFEYQSLGFSFVFTNSFEPILSLLWLLSAACYISAGSFNGYRRIIASALFVLVTVFSITVKENSFIVVSGMGFVAALFSFKDRKVNPQFWLAMGVVITAVIWGGFVYTVIPKDDGYASTAGLNLTLSGLWEAIGVYVNSIARSSGTIIAIGLVLGLLRQVAARKHSNNYIFCVCFAAFQILSVIIWPESSLRLILPAFIVLVYLFCCEITLCFLAVRPMLRNHWSGYAIGFLSVILLFFALHIQHPLTWISLLAIVPALCYFNLPGRFQSIAGWLGSGPVLFLLAGLVVGGIGQLNSYKALYKTTELTRQNAVRLASVHTPQNGKFIWFAGPGQEIFPYSGDIHAELFYNRPDLQMMPATDLKSNILNKGDFILLGNGFGSVQIADQNLKPFSNIQGTYIGAVKDYTDYVTFAQQLVKRNGAQNCEPQYFEGELRLFQITSETWPIPSQLIL